MTFDELWPNLLIPAEFDSMDKCDQERWRGVIQDAFEAGARGGLERRVVWVAYTNTDLTEGRGRDVPLGVCAAEVTALRLARRRYVQGTHGPVQPVVLQKIGDEWYAPCTPMSIVIQGMSAEDIAEQAALDARRAALEKAKKAGLTEADLQALGLEAFK